MNIQKVIKVGNSKGVVIPAPICRKLNLVVGNAVGISLSVNHTIEIKPPKILKQETLL